MSINGYDYGKRLASDREYLAETSKKIQQAADSRVENNEKRSDYILNKQRENFIQDRAELEKNYQGSINNLHDKTEQALDTHKKKLNQIVQKERQDFTRNFENKSKDFNNRLDNIKSSYKKAFESEKDRNETITKSNKNKYERNLKDNKDVFDKKLKDYDDKMSGAGAKVRDKNNQERMQLIAAQEDRLSSAYKDAAGNVGKMKERMTYENKKLKETHRGELDQQKQYLEDKISNIQNKLTEHSNMLTKQFNERNDDLVDAQQRTTEKTNRENNALIGDLKRDHNNTLRKIEIEKLRRNESSDEFGEIKRRQQGLRDQVIHDKRLAHLKDEFDNIQKNYESKAHQDKQNFNNTLVKQSIEANGLLQEKLKKADGEKIVLVSKEREKSEEQLASRDLQNKTDKASYEALLMNERNNANDRMTRLKENFTNSMKMLEEKHRHNFEELGKVKSEDQQKFIKNFEERRTEEVFEMKRAFGKMMDATVQDYEQRIATYQRDNDYLKENMNQKIQTIMDQTDKQIESQRTLFEDRRKSDLKAHKMIMDERENQLQRNFSDMTLNFQKKIDKMQIENDSKIKLITNEYESRLKEMKATVSRELAQKDSDRQIELSRLKETYENEKNRLVSAYESQIEAMKVRHKEQMTQSNEYKRLS